jgi:uncharacterized membrane protein YdfJ with MMPL/SSD domain
VAAERTGRAFFTSALTTLGGFAVLMFSSLPLLSDFGMVVTVNIAVALLSALVVVPPLVQEADRRGLLKMGERTAVTTRARSVAGVAAGVALAVVGTVLVIGAVSDGLDHDREPLVVRGPYRDLDIDLGTFSRRRAVTDEQRLRGVLG